MAEDEDSRSPYVSMDVKEALDLISDREIDVGVCFIDPGLSGAMRELDLVAQFFSVTETVQVSEYFDINPRARMFNQGEHRGRNILLWFATHCDGEKLSIGNPPTSSWGVMDFLFFLNQLKHGGFSEIFTYFNVCFSAGVSDMLWGSFVDMRSGMTIGSSAVHFFVHRRFMAISDSRNAALSEMSESPAEAEESRLSRDRVRSSLEHSELMSGFDRDINYVFIPPPASPEEDAWFWSSIDRNR